MGFNRRRHIGKQQRTNDHSLGLRLVDALGAFWYFRGHIREGRSWFEHFLASSAGTAELAPRRLAVLYGAGRLALEQGDYDHVAGVAEEMHALSRTLDDTLGTARALEMQSTVARMHGDLFGGRALLEQAVSWSRQAGDPLQIGRTLMGLGHSALEVGDHSRAEMVFEELLADTRRWGVAQAEGRVLVGLGLVARERGDYEVAVKLYNEAVGVFARIREMPGFAYCFEGLAALARRRKDMQRAARLCAAATRLRESVASTPTPSERLALSEDVAAARAALGEEAFEVAWSAGLALEFDDAVAYAVR